MRPLRLAVSLVALLGCFAAPAAAAPDLEVGLEDERMLLTEPERAPGAVADWKAMGVDVVRLHARWGHLAPVRRGGAYDWEELDTAMDVLRLSDMKVMLTVTGPGPSWASRRRGDARWYPDPREYGRFARAVATRYGDVVDRYLIWNEPNIPGWLLPQWDCERRLCTLAAPHIYRSLVRAAEPAIRAVDARAEIVVGELAPIGLSESTRHHGRIAPLPFLRAMACVDGRYRPLRTGRCRNFKPLRADAIGYHPHGVKRAPDDRNPDRDEAQIADLPRLTKVLRRLARTGRLRPSGGGRWDVHLTEFGYQTSPPDHAEGVTLAQQVRYLQQAAYLAWREPRVRSLVHYQWEDEPVHFRGPGDAMYAGWQSGLLLVNGRPKPAFESFPSPFVMDRRPGSRTARVWGQVRTGDSHTVTLLRRRRGAEEWTAFTSLRTDARGYFSAVLAVDANAEYRFSWREKHASPYVAEDRYSGVVAPGARTPRRLKAPSAP